MTHFRSPSALGSLGGAMALMGQSVTIATTALTFLWPAYPVAAQTEATFEEGPKAVLDEAWQLVNREYVDPTFNQVDWDAARQRLLGGEYSSRDAAYAALRQELNRLNDPYTRFLDPQEYSDLTDQTSGEASGVGLQLRRDSESQTVLVMEILPGSPAEQAGLQVGDRIVLVDSQATDRLTAAGVARLLRGAENSQVTLTFSRNGGQNRTVILTRVRLELPTVHYALRQVGDYRIGYIRLDEFNAHAAEQMTTAINTLTDLGIDGFVLDLRGNPGGLLSASIEISRMWLQRGPIVLTQGRSGASEQISANRTALTQAPLAVLVNARSASSSEIVTGALKDNDRAVVVGTTTYGKALVQSLYGLADGSGLTVTVAHYYTPNGTDISTRGITPDIEVAMSGRDQQVLFGDPRLLGTEADPQFWQAVTALETTIIAQRQGGQSPRQLGRSSPEDSAE
ncbi:S41 family peptidase [Leptolyngbya sp. PCC 6406]|uniref:S41 family peptidase n=1 Tax=Leptolyngbya sp. PCC 6406 TaxID=1173264 RepID=UPI0002ACE0A7|nr:S41 family peptidase [Leptolyngbya sp. PCC 6406]